MTSNSRYDISTLPAVDLLGYPGSATSMAEVGDVVGPLFARLLSTAANLGMDVDQPSLAWYSGDETAVQLGVGMPADAFPAQAPDDLQPNTLVAAERAVVTRYTGTLDGIGPAWQSLYRHLSEHGLEPAGPAREVYLAGSIDQPDSWVIDLQQPVA